MAFIRRGSIKAPHRHSASQLLHRVDGTPFVMQLRFIQCWEEHELPNGTRVTVLYWGIASSTAVLEPFDELEGYFNRTGVKHV